MDHTSWQIQEKLETLSQLVNDHAPHEAGQVNFRSEGEYGYDLTITYRNDRAGVRDLSKFLKALKESGIIEDIPNIAVGAKDHYPINRNVQVNTEFNNAVIIFTYDNTTEHVHIMPALDHAIKAARRQAEHNNTVITTSRKAEKRDIVTTPPDSAIEGRLKELVDLANYAQAAGTATLSYQKDAFNITFPNDKEGKRNKEKLLKHLGIKHEATPGQSPTSSPEFNVAEGEKTINIIFTPSPAEDNIKFLDKAIENAARHKNDMFRESKTPRNREIVSLYQKNVTHISNFLSKKVESLAQVPAQNISVTHEFGNREERISPKFIITITDDKLTLENMENLTRALNKIFSVNAEIISDTDKHNYKIVISQEPELLAGKIDTWNKRITTARSR